jgi:3-oxoacyl-[acyl-carrier protein] reductase
MEYVIRKLNDYDLAHLLLMGATTDFTGGPLEELAGDGMFQHFPPLYNGHIIANVDMTLERGTRLITAGFADSIAFGRPYIANPDLPERFLGGAPLNEISWPTVYAPGPKGYTDYPALFTDAANSLSTNLGTKQRTKQMSKNNSRKLEGKVAVVTGGSRGIGAAIAKRLAADGASVSITYSKGADAAVSVVKAIENTGGTAIAIQADATDADAVQAAVEKTVATFGRLDVLVNNAGTAIPKRFEETTLEELDRLIDINVRGTLVATQAALKHMKSGSRIIMIGSCVGERVMTPGLVPYSATKGAVKMFTQGLSREVGSRGITVNNVQPGPIDTDLNPAAGEWAVPQKAATALDRYGHVDEVAALVAFVAGPEASYITGANLTVDGGTNA